MSAAYRSRSIVQAGLLVAGLLIAAAPVPATAADAPTFAAAMTTFDRALGGDEAAIESAAERLSGLSAAEPADPVLRAYAGAATALRARTTLWPWRKMSRAEDGLALLDKALAQLTPAHDAARYRGVPASLEARFTAAGTFLALPAMFNRHERGRRLLQDVASSPLLDSAPLPFKGAVWLRAGQEALKSDDKAAARDWLHKLARSGAPQAADAQARLKDL
ncbi:MAG: hypothetical protein HYZ20_02635 [Burkholderiales bacterium]|nr:hypothetical protein [Burkholderiales bacterium]